MNVENKIKEDNNIPSSKEPINKSLIGSEKESEKERKVGVDNIKNVDNLIHPISQFSTPATLPLKDFTDEDLHIPSKSISEYEENSSKKDKEIASESSKTAQKESEIQDKSQSKQSQEVQIVENKEALDQEKKPKEQTILSGALVITNFCLGTTILTLGVRTKHVSLFWMLVLCVICAAGNYWSLLRTCQAGANLKVREFSQVVEHYFGKTHKKILNISIILFSYGFLLTYLTLIYPILGRFVMSVFYKDDYEDFNEFKDAIWSKPYIKWPVQLAICTVLTPVCLLKDMAKLNFTSYLGVGATSYAFIVVIFQCNGYYNHYKETVYKEDDKDTHVNWFDLSKGFTEKLEFFQAMATLFAAYACTTGIYPVYEGFKYQKNGLTKMKWAIFIGIAFTTVLHFSAITSSFLTDPITPEDLIIYRKQKDDGYDIFMNIAKIAISCSLFFTFPGYYFGVRLSIANTFNNGTVSSKFNLITTTLSVFICGAVAILYDKILNYLGYIGGFITPVIVYLYPIMIYVKSKGPPYVTFQNVLEFVGVFFLFVIGWLAGIRTIINDVNGE